MHSALTTELFDAWERGLVAPPHGRSGALLVAVDSGGSTAEDPDDLPLGERDARLLALRRGAFGSRLEAVVSCPACDAELELELDADDLVSQPPADGDAVVSSDAFEIRFRVPTSHDTQAAGVACSVEEARRVLLRRCVVSAVRDGSAIDPVALPDTVVDQVEEAMSRLDPQADLRLDLTCADCGHEWEAPLDVPQFVWTEVDLWAKRLLVEVATLAASFGWSEAQVLALSPTRRDAYLQLVGA